MPIDTITYRVLIASPSDVNEERDIIESEINRWNEINASEREVVLLPVRWETHAAPEFNADPQSVINRDLVDNCDILIGVFWSRLGTATKIADSGTIEEINRMGTAGKLVMLYFSTILLPYDHDEIQLAKVKAFKKKSYPNGLVGNYADLTDFKEKLRTHLDIKARTLDGPSSRSENSALIKTTVHGDGGTPLNYCDGDKRTLVEDTHNAWKESIVDYLFAHAGLLACANDNLYKVFSDLTSVELEHYLEELQAEKEIRQQHSGDIFFFSLLPTGRKRAMDRKILRGSSQGRELPISKVLT